MNILTSILLLVLLCLEVLFSAHARILPDNNNNIGGGEQIKRTFDIIIRTYHGRSRIIMSPPLLSIPSLAKKQITADPLNDTPNSYHYYYKSPPPPARKKTLSSSSTQKTANRTAKKRSPPPSPKGAKPIVHDNYWQYY
ncbi:hypothetical protein CsatB_014979 [Cannabis sativa]|uniref:Uncharacterized protein n=1 Tax=Cannabis sativa TaxID=3483 RepID=A0A803Q7Z7_CANSA|nr:uncharacterized protein LOC115695669 [Cannabis sativa]